MSDLFKSVCKVPSLIAPENNEYLFSEIFKGNPWSLSETDGEANFYALVREKEIKISSAGLASLWNICVVSFTIADIGTQERLKEQSNRKHDAIRRNEIDLSQQCEEKNLSAYISYAE